MRVEALGSRLRNPSFNRGNSDVLIRIDHGCLYGWRGHGGGRSKAGRWLINYLVGWLLINSLDA